MSDKPREFWIDTAPIFNGLDEYPYKKAFADIQDAEEKIIGNEIHTIEYSAFLEMKEECERLKAQFSVAELEAKSYSDLLKEVCEEQASQDLVKCCECEKKVSQNMADKDFCTAAAIVNGEILERDDPTYFCFDCKMKEKDAEIARLREAFTSLVQSCEWYAENGLPHERTHFLAVEARGNYLNTILEIPTSNESGGMANEKT